MNAIDQIGWTAGLLKCAVAYNFRAPKVGLPTFTWPMRVHLQKQGIPVYLRAGTSDYSILKQIFVDDEYEPLQHLDHPRYIVDCGANVGFSSLYFARLYPSARIFAIEPDEQNATVFLRNLSSYADRVELVQSAIWSSPARLVIQRGPVTFEAAIGVREARADEKEDLFAIDIPAVLNRLRSQSPDLPKIDLLKIDIEGSEGELFREPACHQWLPLVRNIAIELHNDICKTLFLKAMERYNFDLNISGELTICRNIAPK